MMTECIFDGEVEGLRTPEYAGPVMAEETYYCFNSSSRSSTDFSSFIRIVIREGCCDVGVPCAVTRAGYRRYVSARV